MNCVEKPGSRAPGTVLIVDDDLDDIVFTQRIIASVCPQLWIRSVRSGEELIHYLKAEQKFSDRTDFPYPLLILLDLSMAEMHGFEVLRWLGNHPPHNGVPVVVLTASGEWKLMQEAYKLGARSFLTKPLTTAEFKNTVDLMGKFQSGQGEQRPPSSPPPQL